MIYSQLYKMSSYFRRGYLGYIMHATLGQDAEQKHTLKVISTVTANIVADVTEFATNWT